MQLPYFVNLVAGVSPVTIIYRASGPNFQMQLLMKGVLPGQHNSLLPCRILVLILLIQALLHSVQLYFAATDENMLYQIASHVQGVPIRNEKRSIFAGFQSS